MVQVAELASQRWVAVKFRRRRCYQLSLPSCKPSTSLSVQKQGRSGMILFLFVDPGMAERLFKEQQISSSYRLGDKQATAFIHCFSDFDWSNVCGMVQLRRSTFLSCCLETSEVVLSTTLLCTPIASMLQYVSGPCVARKAVNRSQSVQSLGRSE